METVLLVGEVGPSSAGEPSARRRPLKRALEAVGYDVVPADDGTGALARLSQRPADLSVLAGTVPDMDLITLCTALRQDQTPFVLVAAAAEHTGRAASRMGADLVFPPTIGATEIADRLRRLF